MRVLFASIVVLAAMGPISAWAGFLAEDVRVAREYGSSLPLTTLEEQTVTVTSGLELDDWYVAGVGVFDIDISDDSILITFNNVLHAAPTIPFNGLTFSDAGGSIPDFNALSLISTSISAFNQSFLSFDANTLYVNLGYDVEEVQGDFIQLSVGFSDGVSVPGPASLALLAIGLLSLGFNRKLAL